MKRKSVSRKKYRKIVKNNSKFHKRNLVGSLRGGRRLPL